MKKLLLLASILLTTLSGFSQQDTASTTQSHQILPVPSDKDADSLVCIPKNLALYMVQDLIAFDYCIGENNSLRNLAITYRNLINAQDTLIKTLQVSESSLKINLNICNKLTEEQSNKIANLEKSLATKTKAKRIWVGIAAAAITGLVITSLH